MPLRENPEVVTAQKQYCGQSHGPCPAEEHEQAAAGCEEENRQEQKELGVVSADSADHNHYGEKKQVERDGDETRKREWEGLRGRRTSCVCGSWYNRVIVTRGVSRPWSLICHSECI